MTRVMVGALVVLLVLLTAGCGSGKRDAAQELADELFPGELSVIGIVRDVGGPVPVPISRVVYAVNADPDAGMIVTDLEADELRAAYAEARWAAAQFRALRDALGAHDLRLVGLRAGNRDGERVFFDVATEITPATQVDVQRRLDTALAAWWQGRGSGASASTGSPSLSVRIVDQAVLAGVVDPDPDWPTALRLSHQKRQQALQPGVRLTARIGKDGMGGLRPVGTYLVPVLADSRRVEARAEQLAGEWLRRERPDLVTEGHDRLETRLETGTMDRLRYYVYACPTTAAQCRREAQRLALTIDLKTLAGSGYRLLAKPAGGWRSPLEPDR